MKEFIPGKLYRVNKNFDALDMSRYTEDSASISFLRSPFIVIKKDEIVMLVENSRYDLPEERGKHGGYSLGYFAFLYNDRVAWYFFKTEKSEPVDCVISEIEEMKNP